MALRIGYFAHGPWAHQALRKILSDKAFEVCFVATRSVGDPTLERIASDFNLPFFVPGRVNEDAELARLDGFGAELFVSMSFDQIFGRRLLALPTKGVVNCHAGELPFYRGRNVLNWALINGESHFGVTVHYIVDEGIDTGPIIQQDLVPIEPQDDYGVLLEKAYYQCAESLHLALMRVIEGVVPTPQESIHTVGFYCGRRHLGDEWIDWRKTSTEVHNFVRGIAPPAPCARTRINEQNLAIIKTELIFGAVSYIGTPGEVVGRAANGGIIVKTGDSALRVSHAAFVEPDGELGPTESVSLPIGSRLSPWIDHRIDQIERQLRELKVLVNAGTK